MKDFLFSMKKDYKILGYFAPIISVICVIIIWCVLSASINDELILPNFCLTVKEFFNLFKSGEFYSSLFMTVLKSLISFLISFILALFFGILSYRHNLFKKFINPIISIMRALPTVAVVLLLLVWTNSFIAPIIVTSLVVLPTVYTGVINDLSNIDVKQIEMCKVFNVNNKDIINKVLLPQIMPSILNTVGSSMSLNIKLMVAAEVLSATGNSLGNLLQYYSNVSLETAKMLSLVIVCIIIGILIECVFSFLSKKAGKNL